MSRVFSGVYVYVCLFVFPHNISKTDAARIIKLDMHCEYWKSFILWSKGQMTRSQGTKNSAGMVFCTLMSAGFFWSHNVIRFACLHVSVIIISCNYSFCCIQHDYSCVHLLLIILIYCNGAYVGDK